MDGKKPASLQNPIDRNVLLQRVARELDRFAVLTANIDAFAVQSIRDDGVKRIDAEVSKALQSIDYLAQASSALSQILTELARNSDGDVDLFLSRLAPTDLAMRLMDQNLDDIDNAGQSNEYF